MIEVVGVKKKFRRKKVLENITFNVKKGEITALLGLNGVGKSTLLKIIMGLVKQDQGEVLFNGEKLNYKTYENIAFVPDVLNTYGDMKIKDAFEYMSMMYEKWDMDKAYEMLKDFKLTDDLKINKLSKGNIARVKLILGFARHPEYLLLDEPFSGIDIFKREDFLKVMTKYITDEQSIIITTHEISEIEMIADDVILIDNGKLSLVFNAEKTREDEGKSILDKMREVYINE